MPVRGRFPATPCKDGVRFPHDSHTRRPSPALCVAEEELGKTSTERHPGCARSDNRASVHLPALIVTIVPDELEAAFALIGSAPNVGHPNRRSPVGETRRVLLAGSRYHVYYVPLGDELVVLAVWQASRGSGPPLRLK